MTPNITEISQSDNNMAVNGDEQKVAVEEEGKQKTPKKTKRKSRKKKSSKEAPSSVHKERKSTKSREKEKENQMINQSVEENPSVELDKKHTQPSEVKKNRKKKDTKTDTSPKKSDKATKKDSKMKKLSKSSSMSERDEKAKNMKAKSNKKNKEGKRAKLKKTVSKSKSMESTKTDPQSISNLNETTDEHILNWEGIFPLSSRDVQFKEPKKDISSVGIVGLGLTEEKYKNEVTTSPRIKRIPTSDTTSTETHESMNVKLKKKPQHDVTSAKEGTAPFFQKKKGANDWFVRSETSRNHDVPRERVMNMVFFD